MKINEILAEKWSAKYKRSINCSNPKGFSQKAHCAGRNKKESIMYVDVDTVHAEALREHLLSNPALYENTEGHRDLRKFLDKHKTDDPKAGNEYVYASVQSVPVSKFVSFAHFSKAHKLVSLEEGYAFFQIGNQVKRFPEVGTLSGDALTEIYFFKSTEVLEKFIMLFDLKFSDYKKSNKPLDENFADGKNPGRKGLSKRVGVSQKMSIGQLEKIAKTATGERRRMAQWNLNMKRGRGK